MASLCFRTSVILALIAAGLALWMTATHDFRTLHAEMVLSVLGWGSFMLYGLYYRTAGNAMAGIRRLHYFVALSGVVVEAVGIVGTEWGNAFFDPVRIIGAFIVAVGFVLFAAIVFGGREVAARS
jgi:hypothetical protein